MPYVEICSRCTSASLAKLKSSECGSLVASSKKSFQKEVELKILLAMFLLSPAKVSSKQLSSDRMLSQLLCEMSAASGDLDFAAAWPAAAGLPRRKYIHSACEMSLVSSMRCWRR